MSKIFDFVRTLMSPDAMMRSRDAAFLAESVDTSDLERRMRILDRGERPV